MSPPAQFLDPPFKIMPLTQSLNRMIDPSAPAPLSSNGHDRVGALILLLCAWLLAGPRVDLIQLGGSSVRLEDLVFVALALCVVANAGPRLLPRTHLRWVAFLAAVSALGVVSAVVTGRTEALPSILYALRPLEYWLVFPAVVLATTGRHGQAHSRLAIRLLAVITFLQVGTASLQVAGVPIGFSKFSYERAAGLTAGPYELGAICATLACFWLWRRSYSLMLLALIGVLVSQSRISIVAVGVGLFIVLASRDFKSARPRRLPSAIRVIAATIGVAAFIFLSGLWGMEVVEPARDRLDDTGVAEAWTQAESLSQTLPPIRSGSDYTYVAFDALGQSVTEIATVGDTSNVIRFFRWQLLLRALSSDPLALLLGLGPSFAGPSVDGGILRIAVELGALGLVAWVGWLLSATRASLGWIGAVLATVAVGSIFIDVTFALRPMVLFWMMMALARSHVDIHSPLDGGRVNAKG